MSVQLMGGTDVGSMRYKTQGHTSRGSPSESNRAIAKVTLGIASELHSARP